MFTRQTPRGDACEYRPYQIALVTEGAALYTWPHHISATKRDWPCDDGKELAKGYIAEKKEVISG